MYLTDENLEELFARRGEELYIYFRGQVNDRQDALDLVAETISRATLNRSKCRGVTFNEMERWIQGIAGNALKEHYGNRRKRRHAMEQLRVQHILLADSTLPAELSDNDMLAVDRWLNQIHPHYAEAVRRRVLEDQSYPRDFP
jgi:DNA-directed RNA polymerase specialized sigma24 family protein